MNSKEQKAVKDEKLVKEDKFLKEDFLRSTSFSEYKDIINAIFKDADYYTKNEALKIIKRYLKEVI